MSDSDALNVYIHLINDFGPLNSSFAHEVPTEKVIATLFYHNIFSISDWKRRFSLRND